MHKKEHQVGGGQKRPAADVTETKDDKIIKRLKDDDPRQNYSLTKIRNQRIEKFKTNAVSYKITFENIDITENIHNTIRHIFSAIFQDVTHQAKHVRAMNTPLNPTFI